MADPVPDPPAGESSHTPVTTTGPDGRPIVWDNGRNPSDPVAYDPNNPGNQVHPHGSVNPNNPYHLTLQEQAAAASINAIRKEEMAARAASEAASTSSAEWQKYLDNRTLQFNPPAIKYATGARYLVDKDRDPITDVLGSGGQRKRVMQKGNLIPDLSYPGDWDDAGGEGDGVDISDRQDLGLGTNSIFRKSPNGKGPLIYGFKFMFNPVTLSFGLSPTTGINLGYIASGQDTSMPLGAVSSGGTISLQFPISRIDDFQAITLASRSPYTDTSTLTGIAKASGVSYRYNPDLWNAKKKGTSITQQDIAGIITKGTMYDLEFLFRTTLGREWNTVYRSVTADVGLMFSVPLRLALSPTMVYRVRLESVGFTHKSFTQDMVPLYTEVDMVFNRIPDVIPDGGATTDTYAAPDSGRGTSGEAGAPATAVTAGDTTFVNTSTLAGIAAASGSPSTPYDHPRGTR